MRQNVAISQHHGSHVMYWRVLMSPAVRTALLVATAGYVIVGLFGATYRVISLTWPHLAASTTTVIAALVAAPAALALVWPHLATVKAFGVEVSIIHATEDTLTADVVDAFMDDATFALALTDQEFPTHITATPQPLLLLNELREATAERVLTVDLRAGHQWLSTRLYLLAAIADAFLRIPRFVFTQHLPQYGFVGMALPAALKIALGLALPPEVDEAYARVRREAAGLALDDRLLHVGVRFVELLAPIERPEGPTSAISAPWVSGDLLYEWMTAAGKNLDTRAIMTTGLSRQQLDLAVALETHDRYIALIGATRELQAVVDRSDILRQVAAARAPSARL